MGTLWCQGFPVVTVQETDTPKPVTFVYPYYENRAFFGAQLMKWKSYPERMRTHLSVVVVDDGSPRHPASEVVDRLGPFPFPLRLFRIEVDVRWNWLAARNIGAHYAADGWLLLTDMDHVVPNETLHAMVFGAHDPSIVYAFHRSEHTGVVANPHSASFFMTREMFWRIGGYDEALSGHYGTDGVYRRELAKHARITLMSHQLIRHEYQGDSSTTEYLRKQPQDAAVKALVAKRGKGWKSRVLSFPYHEVQVRQGVAA
jgi:hypothetical protein